MIPLCSPQPLPADLQPYWDLLLGHSKQRGYAWAKFPYLMKAFGVARWKVYVIINKLRDFGRLAVEEVKGSHERRFYLFSLPPAKPKSNESQTKTRGTLSKYYSPIGEKNNKLTKPERVTERSEVGCSFDSQGEKEKEKEKSLPSLESQSESVTQPLDLPAAAALLVEEGKIAAKIVLRHIRKAGREAVDRACSALIEYSQRKPITCHEKALWRAVDEEWEPSKDFTLSHRRGTVSVESPVSVSPESMPSSFAGYPNAASEWERGVRRHLGGVSRDRYANLMERADRRLAGIRYSPDTLCEYMAKANRFDQKDEAATPV